MPQPSVTESQGNTISHAQGWHTFSPLSVIATLTNCVYELMHAEAGRFPLSVLCCPVMQEEQQFAGFTVCGGSSSYPSFSPAGRCHMIEESWLVAWNWQVTNLVSKI